MEAAYKKSFFLSFFPRICCYCPVLQEFAPEFSLHNRPPALIALLGMIATMKPTKKSKVLTWLQDFDAFWI